MDFYNKITESADEYKIDESLLTSEEIALLKSVNFPFLVKSGLSTMRRTKRKAANGFFTDKEILKIEDISYLTTAKHIAKTVISQMSTMGRTLEETAMKEAHVEGVRKSDAFRTDFIDSTVMKYELDWLLSNFALPKPTKSMEEVKTVVKAKAPKAELTEEQETKIKELFTSGAMSAVEIAKELNITKTLVIAFIKTLN